MNLQLNKHNFSTF